MKYYDELVDMGCFTTFDLQVMTGNKKTTESLLLRYLKYGFIKRVKHNFYVVINIVDKVPVCNKYEIAIKLDKSNYIAYHSALEYYGLNNQVFNEVVFCSDRRINDFDFDRISYHYVKNKCDYQLIDNYDNIRVTSIERTIIDCIDKMDLAGGIEEIYRAFDSINNINEEKILEILDYYNKKVLYQRTGYILETFKNNLKITDNTLNYIHKKIGSSKCYLNSSKKISNTFYNKKSNICVPSYLSLILGKGVDVNNEF